MTAPYSILQELRATLVLAVPLALTQLTQVAMSFVDVVMIGRLGPEALAAGVLGTTVYFTLLLMCMGVVMAVNPMVAQAVGARDPAAVGRAVRQGLWLALLLGLPLMALLSQVERLLLLARQEPATAALAATYVRAVLWGVLPHLAYTALRSFAEGIARPRPVLVVAILAAITNAGINYVLMYGALGLPALGLRGCAIGTALTSWAMFGLLVLVVRTNGDFRRYGVFMALRRPDAAALRALFRLGWPIGIGFGLESGLFTAAALMTGLSGATALAAHQIAINAASVAFMIPLGVAMATTVRVGQAAGRGDRAAAERAGWTGVAMGAAFMVLTALLFWLRPGWVVWVYTGGGAREVAEVATGLLGIAAVFQLLDGVQVTAGGALRGLKDTRTPMFVGAIAYWGVGMTAAYGLGLAGGYGVRGVWWGLVLGLGVAAVLLTVRFRARVRRPEGWQGEALAATARSGVTV